MPKRLFLDNQRYNEAGASLERDICAEVRDTIRCKFLEGYSIRDIEYIAHVAVQNICLDIVIDEIPEN